MLQKLLFILVPLLVIATFLGMIYFGVTTYINISGPVTEDSMDLTFQPQQAVGKIFIPHLLRKDANAYDIELEIETIGRQAGEVRDLQVYVTDTCDYIDIDPGVQPIVFQDKEAGKKTVKFPISIRNTLPPLNCTINAQVNDKNGIISTFQKTLPVDIWTIRAISIAAAVIGVLGTALSLGIIGLFIGI